MQLLNTVKQFNSWNMDCSRDEHRAYSPAVIILGTELLGGSRYIRS